MTKRTAELWAKANYGERGGVSHVPHGPPGLKCRVGYVTTFAGLAMFTVCGMGETWDEAVTKAKAALAPKESKR